MARSCAASSRTDAHPNRARTSRRTSFGSSVGAWAGLSAGAFRLPPLRPFDLKAGAAGAAGAEDDEGGSERETSDGAPAATAAVPATSDTGTRMSSSENQKGTESSVGENEHKQGSSHRSGSTNHRVVHHFNKSNIVLLFVSLHTLDDVEVEPTNDASGRAGEGTTWIDHMMCNV